MKRRLRARCAATPPTESLLRFHASSAWRSRREPPAIRACAYGALPSFVASLRHCAHISFHRRRELPWRARDALPALRWRAVRRINIDARALFAVVRCASRCARRCFSRCTAALSRAFSGDGGRRTCRSAAHHINVPNARARRGKSNAAKESDVKRAVERSARSARHRLETGDASRRRARRRQAGSGRHYAHRAAPPALRSA